MHSTIPSIAFRPQAPSQGRLAAPRLCWDRALGAARLLAVACAAGGSATAFSSVPAAAPAPPPATSPAPVSQAAPADVPGGGPLYIREYRVNGAHHLPAVEVEETVYPFLGPGRSAQDVEQARAALEKAYHDKGFQGASVQIPQQNPAGGIIVLQVLEGTVERLRVTGARYFSPSQIKAQARSLAEGKVVNFNDVTRDIVGLNQLPDRHVTPTLTAGAEPGTVDIDLNVKDTLPLHGSVELNNRYSANTTPLRLNGSLSYNNLWQEGHTAGFNFQVSPENISEVQVYSGYYVARFPDVDWLSLSLSATRQKSNVNSLGAIAVAGNGEVLGGRAIITLPGGKDFFQSVSIGLDYKHFRQAVGIGGITTQTPTSYYPVSANYNGTLQGKNFLTTMDAGVTFGFRGLGSRQAEYTNNRFKSDANFIVLRGDLAHTQELPKGVQAFARLEGQVADQPLLNTEEFGGGGLGTVRGYLEAEELGDNGLFATLELRTPSLLSWSKNKTDEWRFYAFTDAGFLTLRNPLPEQTSQFNLASYGFGSRLHVLDHLNASVDAAIPLYSATQTTIHDFVVTFRLWADF